MDAGAVLDIQGLTKRFAGAGLLLRALSLGRARHRDIVALDGVDVRVERGEIVAVLGPNGSGKSTLLRCAAGLIVPTAGTVRVTGHDPAAIGTQLRGHIGLVARDDRSFDFRLTGIENLEFFSLLQGIGQSEIHARVSDALALVRLRDAGAQPFRTYSTGMRQRLAVARALLGEPKLLLLDEASSGLDPGMRGVFHDVIERLAAETGVGVLVATHDLAEAQYLCSRVLLLDGGRVAGQGDYLTVEPMAEALFRRNRNEAEA